MKRDMSLIRQLDLAIEASPSGCALKDLVADGYSREEIGCHLVCCRQPKARVSARALTSRKVDITSVDAGVGLVCLQLIRA